MLVDEIEFTIKAGDGGEGVVSFGKHAKSGPDGGNGGDGGDVYLKSSSDLTLLDKFKPRETVEAEDGEKGRHKKQFGARGNDLELLVPFGSQITDLDTGDAFELIKPGERIMICRGGKGGIGNWELRSSRNTTPKNTIPATKGQVREVKIVLRFIADFGLIGLPSAGKSSLLNELTNANVKTAAYHFTTLSPNLGVLPNKKIIADIPGLIEGANEGKGLGIKFLKHIQKVNTLFHCISSDSKDPLTDYEIVRKELGKYEESLLKKNEVILVTKSDLVDKKDLEKKKKALMKTGRKIYVTSIYDPDSIETLIALLLKTK